MLKDRGFMGPEVGVLKQGRWCHRWQLSNDSCSAMRILLYRREQKVPSYPPSRTFNQGREPMATGWIRHQRWRQLHDDYGVATGIPGLEPRYDLVLGGAGWLRQHNNTSSIHAETGVPDRAEAPTAVGLLACLQLRLSYPDGCFFGVLHAGIEARGHLKALEDAVEADRHVGDEATASEIAKEQQSSATETRSRKARGFVLTIVRVPMQTLQVASLPNEQEVWLGSRDVSTRCRRKPQIHPSTQRIVTRREVVANGMPYALVAIRWAT